MMASKSIYEVVTMAAEALRGMPGASISLGARLTEVQVHELAELLNCNVDRTLYLKQRPYVIYSIKNASILGVTVYGQGEYPATNNDASLTGYLAGTYGRMATHEEIQDSLRKI